MKRLLTRVRRRHLAVMVAMTLCLSAVVGLLVTPSSDRKNTAARESPNCDDTIPARTLALTTHDPILIDGNANFTNASGVVWGSGTESDPYTIEGWDINAFSANGIHILNTDVHFIVRDCFVYGGDSVNHGIYLYNCVDGTISNNTCSNYYYAGISLAYSSSNTLNNNKCSESGNGISLAYSSNNTLNNNTCSSNGGAGIGISTSDNNTLNNNNCGSNSYQGIYLSESSNNTLNNNTCNSDGYSGIDLWSSCNNTMNNNICASSSRGMTLTVYSNDNILTSNTCSSNMVGISLEASSNDNTLNKNNCSNNGRGIDLISGNNSLINNTCSSNNGAGIVIYSGSDGNTVYANSLLYNNGATDTYDSAHVQAHDDGTSNWWNSTDGYGNYWSDWTGPDADLNGIVDLPYNISGSAGAKDYYPLTTPQAPIPEFGMMPLVVMAFMIVIVITRRMGERK